MPGQSRGAASVRHVVWDWNGTLLDDFDIVVAAADAACQATFGQGMDADAYRSFYARPVRRLYEAVVGRPVEPEEWAALNRCYHEQYRRGLGQVGLAGDAIQALQKVSGAGCTQSVLSMWSDDELGPLVRRLGLGVHFIVVQGLPSDVAGENKAPWLTDHLGRVSGRLGRPLDPSEALMVGDSLDDAAAGRAVGARVVLVDGGSHHLAALQASGAPVAANLVEAVDIGLALRPGGQVEAGGAAG